MFEDICDSTSDPSFSPIGEEQSQHELDFDEFNPDGISYNPEAGPSDDHSFISNGQQPAFFPDSPPDTPGSHSPSLSQGSFHPRGTNYTPNVTPFNPRASRNGSQSSTTESDSTATAAARRQLFADPEPLVAAPADSSGVGSTDSSNSDHHVSSDRIFIQSYKRRFNRSPVLARRKAALPQRGAAAQASAEDTQDPAEEEGLTQKLSRFQQNQLEQHNRLLFLLQQNNGNDTSSPEDASTPPRPAANRAGPSPSYRKSLIETPAQIRYIRAERAARQLVPYSSSDSECEEPRCSKQQSHSPQSTPPSTVNISYQAPSPLSTQAGSQRGSFLGEESVFLPSSPASNPSTPSQSYHTPPSGGYWSS